MTTWTPTALADDAAGLAPSEALLKTLEDHLLSQVLPEPLQGQMAGRLFSRIVQGWSAQSGDLVYPTLGIDAADAGTRVGRRAVELFTIGTPAAEDPVVRYVVVTGTIERVLDLNIWASSKAQRERLSHALELALRGDPLESGLVRVNSDHYYGLPISFWQDGSGRYMDTEGAVARDEFRAYYTVGASMLEVMVVEGPRILNLDVLANLVELRASFVDSNQQTWKVIEG